MRYPFFICRIIVVFVLGLQFVSYGQTTAVLTGKVTDATTGKPMPFAHVYVNGSTQGAITDEKGDYTLSGIPLGTVEIVASFVGYHAAAQKIRFENASGQKANFLLRASEQMLDAITIRGSSKRSERHLRQFKKEIFGEPFGGQCLLVNSEALNFKEDKGHLYATANEPLIIENQALGYRLIYDLQHFDATPSKKVYFAGTARFEELKSESERQAARIQRNRLTAYKGSARHLMASLIDGTFEQAGFWVYQEDATKPLSVERRTITLAAAISEYKRLIPIEVSKLIQPGRLPNERKLVSSMKLIVFYTKASSGFSPYPDARYAYTEIHLPGRQMQMTVDGNITMPEGMVTTGSMGNDRLSTMLPADWKPEGGDVKAPPTDLLLSRWNTTSPDTSLRSISASFDERFKFLSPTVFAHIDKPFYVTGDRLWMSTYLLDATSHQQVTGKTALHVDLLTATGKLVQHEWVNIADGRGRGSFRLSDTLMTGIYRLRAYTDEDVFQLRPAFERSVAIYNLFRQDLPVTTDSVYQQPDIQILPEGGQWISGLPARLGIKIVQPNGKGLVAEGRIIDDLGTEVARFKTNQQGMTSVLVESNAGRTYYAEVSSKTQLQKFPLPKPANEGLSLFADAISDTTLLSLTIRSSNRAANDSAYILIQQRGVIVDQGKIFLKNGMAKVSLPMTGWSPGLAQVTLYDAKAVPQGERLFFVPEFVAPVQVTLRLNKPQYQPREQVVLSINVKDNGLPVAASLSASITDVSKVPADTTEATFRAHLLLSGELRGHVERPDQYLKNNSAETRKALDDLLLTQGWRRVSGTPEADTLGGISLSGRILNLKKQPIPGAQVVVMSAEPRQSFVESVRADQQGRFRVAGMAIVDTVNLLVQVSGKDSRKMSPKEVIMSQEGPGKMWEMSNMTTITNRAMLQAQLEAARIRQEANAELYRDNKVETLNEVTVRTQKYNERPEDIQMRSLHKEADAVITLDERSPTYPNLYEMIQGRFAGVTVIRMTPKPGGPPVPPGYQVSIRGMSSFKSGTQPLYLMDGVPVQDPDGTVLMNFNPSDIERVEVLKSAATAGIYGVRGGNGVIAFYSKGARSMQSGKKPNESMRPMQFIGYPSVQREFYVPRYDADVTASTRTGRIDDRDVLYWKPMILTDSQGNSQLRFPLSDVVQTLRVVIQGITADGRPVVGVHSVRVQ